MRINHCELRFDYTARNAQVAASLLQTCCKLRSSSRYQDAFASLAPAWWQQVCCKLSTGLLQAASCELQTCCKLRTAGLLQIVNCRLAANCELQACCKLWTAGLLQVANCRLAASCELPACCKLWTAGLLQVANCRLAANCELQTCSKLSLSYLLQIVETTCSKPAVDMATMDIREHATRGFRICLDSPARWTI